MVRCASALLAHLTLILAVYGGAGLATAARLKWDPSTYLPLRQLLPLEYRVAAGALCAAAAALLALGHLAAAGLRAAPRARRPLLLTYAVAMTALMCAEAAWVAWSGARLAAWLRSQEAEVLQLLELHQHLKPLLSLLAHWHPLPDRIRELMEEAEADVPRNLHVAAAAAALLAVLQPAAVLAALCAAARPSYTPSHDSLSYQSTDHEKAPLRTAFRNGKLVIV